MQPTLPSLVSLFLPLALILNACGGGSTGPTLPSAGSNAGAGTGSSGTLPNPDVSSIAAADPGSRLDASWRQGPIMEIYVRGYADSDGDGYGDLRGLLQKLDYLQTLGVRGLWLMPTTASQDNNHGYAVNDYRAIEKAYGTLADFDALVEAAHARGMGIIVDYVMNHSASTHPLFVNAQDSRSNTYRDWYVWQDTMPLGWSVYGGNPWRSAPTGAYYAAFSQSMPDFNLRKAEVVDFHKSNLRFWLNRGVDGVRFDAVGNLFENGPTAWRNQPESYALMRDIQGMVGTYRNRFMVCEAPDDPSGFADACGSAFAFSHQHDLINAARGDTQAAHAVATYPLTAPPGIATFLANHDSFAGGRVWDQLNGDETQYRLAAATYLLQPGVPFLYYGEEIGISGGAGLSGDTGLRAPMSWTAQSGSAGFTSGQAFRALPANYTTHNVASEDSDPQSLLRFYRTLIALRNAHPALAQGSYRLLSESEGCMVFLREIASERIVVALNYTHSAHTLSGNDLPGGDALPLYPSAQEPLSISASGAWSLNLPAQSLRVLQLKS